MSLPLGQTFLDYSSNVLQLFQTYEWAFNYKGIEILLPQNKCKIPLEFVNFCNSGSDGMFQQILHCNEHFYDNSDFSSYPSIIRNFVQLCKDVSISPTPCDLLDLETPNTNRKNWTSKKVLEVNYLSAFIGKLVQQNNCDLIVDIGSGLGYLSTDLAETYGIPVMAIESETDRHTTASASATAKSVIHVNLKLNSEIGTQLNPLVSKYSSILITGLHSCGDLTPWSMNWFFENPKCKLLAIVPCCYHRMGLNGPGPGSRSVTNLPMSDALKQIVQIQQSSILTDQFCRLASQRAGENFLNDIGNESRHAFYRAVLELYIYNGNFGPLIRNKRKVIKGDPVDFNNYIDKTIGPNGGYNMLPGDFESHKVKLIQLHDENLNYYKVITGLLSMQGVLQPIAENFILLDRLQYLLQHEEIIEDACMKRIIPKNVSPRGMTLYAKKR